MCLVMNSNELPERLGVIEAIIRGCGGGSQDICRLPSDLPKYHGCGNFSGYSPDWSLGSAPPSATRSAAKSATTGRGGAGGTTRTTGRLARGGRPGQARPQPGRQPDGKLDPRGYVGMAQVSRGLELQLAEQPSCKQPGFRTCGAADLPRDGAGVALAAGCLGTHSAQRGCTCLFGEPPVAALGCSAPPIALSSTRKKALRRGQDTVSPGELNCSPICSPLTRR